MHGDTLWRSSMQIRMQKRLEENTNELSEFFSFPIPPLWTLDVSCMIHKTERFGGMGGISMHANNDIKTQPEQDSCINGTEDYLCQIRVLYWDACSLLLFRPNHLWEVTSKTTINALKCIPSEIARSQRGEWKTAQDSFMWWRENKWQITQREEKNSTCVGH